MKGIIQLMIWLLLEITSACSVLQQAANHDFGEGIYRVSRLSGVPVGKKYVGFSTDSIFLYPITGRGHNRKVDTIDLYCVSTPDIGNAGSSLRAVFFKTSIDLDLTTILLKYRFATAGVPPQLNSQFNGALYAGLRYDFYRLRYRPRLLGGAQRNWSHLGIDAGPFIGIGATPVNPDLTRSAVSLSYDGVVWQKGLAAFAGFNNFTLGLTLGWEHLLDGNRKFWIYQGKPWLGLAIGLALN